MAVLKSKRSESSAQFLDTALKLEEYTILQCMKLPKRATFFVGERVAKLASDIADNTKSANTIFPNSIATFEQRENYFLKAKCATQCLISKVALLKRMYSSVFKENVWIEWDKMLIDMTRLLTSVIKNDRERKKNFIEKQKKEIRSRELDDIKSQVEIIIKQYNDGLSEGTIVNSLLNIKNKT